MQLHGERRCNNNNQYTTKEAGPINIRRMQNNNNFMRHIYLQNIQNLPTEREPKFQSN